MFVKTSNFLKILDTLAIGKYENLKRSRFFTKVNLLYSNHYKNENSYKFSGLLNL